MLLSSAIVRWPVRSRMNDQLLSLARPSLCLIAKPPNVRDRVRLIPAFSRSEISQPVGCPRGPLPENNGAVRHEDVESIAGVDSQLALRFARDDDLMLG